MSHTRTRFNSLLAIVIASVIVLCMTGVGMVTGMIPDVSRQAAAAPQPAAEAQPQGRPGGPLWTAAARTCARCGTVAVVYYIEQENEGPVKTRRWDVVVEMDEGGSRTFSSTAEPSFRPGDRVMVVGRAIMV